MIFLRLVFERGHEVAFSVVGARYFRSVDVPEDEPVEFELQVGETVWKLRFPMAAAGINDTFGEELFRGGKRILRAAMFEQSWSLGDDRLPRDEVRCCAKVLWDRGNAEWMAPFVDAIAGISVFKSYWLNQVQRSEVVNPLRASYLHTSGRNLWSVLAGWKAARLRTEERFDWVMTHARKAFPGLISTVEFENGFPLIFPRGAADVESALPPERVADGLLTGLLHLTAIAGARPGAVIAFDEENRLHPYAIRLLLRAMRQCAEEPELTVVVTTHSPVVMNEFRDDLEQVFVLEHQETSGEFPVRVTELHTEEWLAQAKLGTLYDRLAFGAPPISSPEP